MVTVENRSAGGRRQTEGRCLLRAAESAGKGKVEWGGDGWVEGGKV
jgi:hypothetical protein